MSPRYQTGCVWRKKSKQNGRTVYGSKWYVRYYESRRLEDGRIIRAQKNSVLCNVDRDHSTATCKGTKDELAKFMATVNRQQGTSDSAPISVVDFWTQTYWPFVQKNKRPATASGYQQIWNQHLRCHFEACGATVQNYRTAQGSQFLMTLTDTLGQRSIAHVRSLASGIFSHAVNLGLRDSNPWHDVKVLGRVRPPKPTLHYTLEEIEDIISALVEHVDCQSVVALSFFTALRPSEISALRWEDFEFFSAPDENGNVGLVHIRRACVRGVVGETKTPESAATLPLVPQVGIPLILWRQKNNNPTEGWCFPNERGNPPDMRDVVSSRIRPTVKKAGLVWKSLYAGRRGGATAVVDLTNGNIASAQELLRHKHWSTTAQFYKKQTQTALASGLKALASASAATSAAKNSGGSGSNGSSDNKKRHPQKALAATKE